MDVEDMHAIDVAAIKNIADVMFIFFPFFIHMEYGYGCKEYACD